MGTIAIEGKVARVTEHLGDYMPDPTMEALIADVLTTHHRAGGRERALVALLAYLGVAR